MTESPKITNHWWFSEDACHLKLLSEYTSASALPVTSLLLALKMFSPSLQAMNIVAAYSKCHCLSQAHPWSYHAIQRTSFASSDLRWIRPFKDDTDSCTDSCRRNRQRVSVNLENSLIKPSFIHDKLTFSVEIPAKRARSAIESELTSTPMSAAMLGSNISKRSVPGPFFLKASTKHCLASLTWAPNFDVPNGARVLRKSFISNFCVDCVSAERPNALACRRTILWKMSGQYIHQQSFDEPYCHASHPCAWFCNPSKDRHRLCWLETLEKHEQTSAQTFRDLLFSRLWPQFLHLHWSKDEPKDLSDSKNRRKILQSQGSGGKKPCQTLAPKPQAQQANIPLCPIQCQQDEAGALELTGLK